MFLNNSAKGDKGLCGEHENKLTRLQSDHILLFYILLSFVSYQSGRELPYSGKVSTCVLL